MVAAFSHKPTQLSIHNGIINHNGIREGYLYIVDEPIAVGVNIIQHPNSSFEAGLEMQTKRNLKLKRID